MSAPPPGYNGESMLQAHGGTAEIVPVMGGGRVKKALDTIRKKHTRKPKSKRKSKGTKKRKQKGAQRKDTDTGTETNEQEGGAINHYTLNETDEYKKNKSVSTRTATLTKVIIPKEKIILPVQERDLSTYLKNQGKLWVRKLNTSVLLRSELKSKVPTTDNIGCTFTLGIQTINRIVRYAPDRLCCILPKETSRITLFPAVNGDVNTFLRIARYIKEQVPDDKHQVFIFSPPFLGVNLENNKQIFDYFLYYKQKVSNAINQWKFYILTEYSTQNIEAAKALSLAIRPDAATTALLKQYIVKEREFDTTYPDTTLITSIYSMLEPTYIIYPYTLSFPTSSAETIVASLGKISREEYNKQMAVIQQKKTEAEGKQEAASKLVTVRENEYTAAAKEAWERNASLTTAGTALNTPKKDIASLEEQINTDALALTNMGTGVAGTPEYTRAQSALDAKKAELQAKKDGILGLQRSYDTASENYGEAEKAVISAKKSLAEAKQAESSAKGVFTKAETEFNETKAQLDALLDEESVANKAPPKEKGGILFSAATNGEAILPMPYSGFDGAIKYVQTNDSQTMRGSIAYRVAAAKREPILDAMDYEEYNLLQAPPMNDHSIFTFILTLPSAAASTEIASNLDAFIGSPTVVQNHVPDVSVSVGPQDYSIRSPVPDVINDWNNGIFSNDEANYLNAMKLSPKILKEAFPNGWKKPLSDHLSMITRSNCFKDSRLLLHADCQEAQAFISRILEYFMSHTNSILSKQQQDSYAKNMETKFNALAAKLANDNGIAGKDIFDTVAFIETFFPKIKKDGTPGVPGVDYLVSVNSIKVDREDKEYIVSYDAKDKLGIDEMQSIGKQLIPPDTLKESPGTKPDEYVWTFTQKQGEDSVTRIARSFIRTFTITSEYDTTPSTTFSIVHRGSLSELDKALLKKKIGGFTEKPGELTNMYVWELEVAKSQKELQSILDSIENANELNYTIVENPTADAEDVTAQLPNTDLVTNRKIKVFALALSSEPSKTIYAEFSMDYPPGKTTDETIAIMEKKYNEIANKINARPPQPLAFGGRYIFHSDD